MAIVDGDWDVVIRTPMGEQAVQLSLTGAGDSFSGTAPGEIGSVAIEGGRIEGDVATWSMNVKMPFPVTLTGRVTIKGDSVEGTVDAGMMGLMPLSGTRRA